VYREPPDEAGKQRQVWKGGFPTKKAAQEFLVATLGAVNEGNYVSPSKLAVKAFIEDEWLPAIAATVRPSTYRCYESVARTRIIPALGSMPLQRVTPPVLLRVYQEWEAAGLSAATRKHSHTILSRIFKDAVRWGRLARSPVSQVSAPKVEDGRAVAWSAKELHRFLTRAREDELWPLWRLAVSTGMRRGELLGLTWRHLDLEGRTLAVEQQLVPIPGGVEFGPPKSKRSRRTIGLSDEVVEVLREHREVQKLERDLAGDAYVDRDLVFADPLGAPLHPQGISGRFLRLRKSAGLTVGTMHVTRHTHATHLLLRGVPLHVVAARLGDLEETVLRNYAHLLPDSEASAVAVMEQVLAA
jgi:integrase